MRMYFSAFLVLVVTPWLLWATLPATDAFTGTDGTTLQSHGTSWTMNSGNIEIQSNGVHPFVGGTYSLYHWNADAFANDQYAQVVMTSTMTTGTYIGPAVRVHASAITGYRCIADNIQILLEKVVAGTVTQMASTFVSLTAGQVFRIEATGTTVQCLADGSVISGLSVSDSDIASGSAGLGSFGAGDMLVDNWEGGAIGSGGGSTPRKRVVVTQ